MQPRFEEFHYFKDKGRSFDASLFSETLDPPSPQSHFSFLPLYPPLEMIYKRLADEIYPDFNGTPRPPQKVFYHQESLIAFTQEDTTRFKEGSVALKYAKTCNCPAQDKDVTPTLGKRITY